VWTNKNKSLNIHKQTNIHSSDIKMISHFNITPRRHFAESSEEKALAARQQQGSDIKSSDITLQHHTAPAFCREQRGEESREVTN
jgi:hypothetical protein